jgi:hypothetical protein
MNTLRLVKDGAVIEKGIIYDGGNWINVIKLSDTIPIESEWNVEEAAVLCQISKNQWLQIEGILRSHFLPYLLHDLISLSLSYSKSGLSLEQFIEGMKEYQ